MAWALCALRASPGEALLVALDATLAERLAAGSSTWPTVAWVLRLFWQDGWQPSAACQQAASAWLLAACAVPPPLSSKVRLAEGDRVGGSGLRFEGCY